MLALCTWGGGMDPQGDKWTPRGWSRNPKGSIVRRAGGLDPLGEESHGSDFPGSLVDLTGFYIILHTVVFLNISYKLPEKYMKSSLV